MVGPSVINFFRAIFRAFPTNGLVVTMRIHLEYLKTLQPFLQIKVCLQVLGNTSTYVMMCKVFVKCNNLPQVVKLQFGLKTTSLRVRKMLRYQNSTSYSLIDGSISRIQLLLA